ncbi:MAG: diguanylate cyclase [Pseudonocardiaceae bacterium]|nr:diguanylate cyclase [Pseudonocardiaceae bacterium]
MRPRLTGAPPPGPSGEGMLTDAVIDGALAAVGTAGDDELVDRARELLARSQRERPQRQAIGVDSIDVLLDEARCRGSPVLVGQLLRYAGVIRLVTHTPLAHADPLLDELTAHATRHRMPVLLADAHALRARRAVLAATEEAALSDAATALALLADEPDATDPRSGRALATALTDLGLVLTQLGAHELADEVFERSQRHLQTLPVAQELLVNALNRLRLLLSWALRLERAGHVTQATRRFAEAADVGRTVDPLWRSSIFHAGGTPPAQQCAVLGAALALADPGIEHVPRLHGLTEIANFTPDRIVVAIALGRSLERDGWLAEAMAALTRLRDTLPDGAGRSEPMLQLALSRELARLQAQLVPDSPSAEPIDDYAAALEAEMWSLRQARIGAMRTQAEHVRLAREHVTATEQALSDPLTGLPNRRAMDGLLTDELATTTTAPCSVALLDIDGFKEVNDTRSHAVGDEVLRAVAGVLRESLRCGDTVARYGGDEFVVVLPDTAPAAAAAALARAVRAVAGLPPASGAGVTLSAGVVALGLPRSDDSATAVLSRADAAMYQAKRLGGDRVEAGSPTVSTTGARAARHAAP